MLLYCLLIKYGTQKIFEHNFRGLCLHNLEVSFTVFLSFDSPGYFRSRLFVHLKFEFVMYSKNNRHKRNKFLTAKKKVSSSCSDILINFLISDVHWQLTINIY